MSENNNPLLAQLTAAHVRFPHEKERPFYVTNTLRMNEGMVVEVDGFGLHTVRGVTPTSVHLIPCNSAFYGVPVPAGTPILQPQTWE